MTLATWAARTDSRISHRCVELLVLPWSNFVWCMSKSSVGLRFSIVFPFFSSNPFYISSSLLYWLLDFINALIESWLQISIEDSNEASSVGPSVSMYVAWLKKILLKKIEVEFLLLAGYYYSSIVVKRMAYFSTKENDPYLKYIHKNKL